MKIILQNNLSLNKSGVYLITNLINGKIYVGSSSVIQRRLNEYLNIQYITRNLKKGNSKLLNAFFEVWLH